MNERWMLAAGVGVLAIAGSVEPGGAAAAQQCPDGMHPVQRQDGTPDCAADAYVPPSRQPRAPVLNLPDLGPAVAAQADAFRAAVEGLRDAARRAPTPDQIAYRSGGVWKIPPGAGQCRALFLSPEGTLGIYGPGRNFDAVALTFQSEMMSKAAKPQQLKVELEERNLDTGKVVRFPIQALHEADSVTMFYKGHEFAQAIDSMIDRGRYRVLLKGKPLVEMSMRGGLAAQAELRACAGGRR